MSTIDFAVLGDYILIHIQLTTYEGAQWERILADGHGAESDGETLGINVIFKIEVYLAGFRGMPLIFRAPTRWRLYVLGLSDVSS